MKLHLSVILLASAIPAQSSASCSRALLEDATTRYVAAQSAGQPQWLESLLAPNATFLENLSPVARSASVLNKPLAVVRARHTYDTVACAAYSELLALEPSPGVVIGTQLRLSPPSSHISLRRKRRESAGAKITRVDSIVTGDGDLYFNASHTLHYALGEDWGVIPPAMRDSRETLVKAADAYYAVFSDNSTRVPWLTPCRRLEGGAYMAAGMANDTCSAGLPPFAVTMRERRYVVDESVGSVNIISDFGILGPDSHEMRIEGGKLRYIHAMTSCKRNGKPNCDAPAYPGLADDVGF
ncbi:hypothetical protein F4780DRAFT_346652 [Xylariomycetidae sp. FL0641]|nr:hypothetical protein F4780DRAFT_346652 [Xylariomycetidae sp. FL0641]